MIDTTTPIYKEKPVSAIKNNQWTTDHPIVIRKHNWVWTDMTTMAMAFSSYKK